MELFNSFSLDQFSDWILSFVLHQSFLAPIILLFLEEAGLPLPTADFVIAYTGYHVSLGHLTFSQAFVILLIADLLGSSLLYFLCSRYGLKLINKLSNYVNLDLDKLDIVAKKFKKYGSLVIILGRHVPGFRIPITIFSGLSHMTYRTFIGSTFISVFFWMWFYLSLGERLGPKTVELLQKHGAFGLLFLLPILFFMLPFFFLRKNKKK